MTEDIFSLVELVAGLTFILLGLAQFINKDIMRTYADLFSSNRDSNQAISQVILVAAMIFGLIIVSTHNDWSMGLSIITTAVGWVFVIKSFLWLAFRNKLMSLVRKMKPIMLHPMFNFLIGAFMIVVGALITYGHIGYLSY